MLSEQRFILRHAFRCLLVGLLYLLYRFGSDFVALRRFLLEDESLHRWSLASALFLTALSVLLWPFMFRPLDVRKKLEDMLDVDVLGRRHPKGEIRTNKMRGKTPPPFPNGWFKLLDSFQLRKGEVKNVEAFGVNLAVFRADDDEGKVSILDAYCPHLGANLAGGKVVGDCLECPFHGWKFDGEGHCVEVPYAPKKAIPEAAKTLSWPCSEVNGAIFVWYHADDAPPEWQVPVIPELKAGSPSSWVYHARAEHEVNTHIQDIPENVADYTHLDVLHIPFMIPGLGLDKLINHKWELEWRPGEAPDVHLAYVDIKPYVTLKGWKVPGSQLHVKATQVGPGIIHLDFMTMFGRLVVIQTPTPINEQLLIVKHAVFAEPKVPRFFAKISLKGILVQFERDIPIWNNKTFRHKPVLVLNDGPIAKFRRWFSHFYSASSDDPAKRKGSSARVSLDW
ncbi:cholesterol 7-desaturase [Balamuthia mandrillaris]